MHKEYGSSNPKYESVSLIKGRGSHSIRKGIQGGKVSVGNLQSFVGPLSKLVRVAPGGIERWLSIRTCMTIGHVYLFSFPDTTRLGSRIDPALTLLPALKVLEASLTDDEVAKKAADLAKGIMSGPQVYRTSRR